tara:strand:+ start:13115 stop:13468 length:354 start_codon:yes stop_codon:yes gene_type:complete
MQLPEVSSYEMHKHLHNGVLKGMEKTDPVSYRMIEYLISFQYFSTDYRFFDVSNAATKMTAVLLKEHADLRQQILTLEETNRDLKLDLDIAREALEENKQIVLKERQNFPTVSEDLC